MIGRRLLGCLFASCLALTACAGVDFRPVARRSAPPPPAEVDTGCSYFYYLWGKTAELQGRDHFDEALEAYEKALVCDPGADHVQENRVLLLIMMGRRQEAAAVLEEMVERRPDDRRYVSLLARLYASMGEVDRARAVYEQALSLRPDDPELLLLLGTLHARNGEYDRAAAVLERAVAVAPDSPAAHLALGRLYRELKLFDRAVEQYETVLRLEWSPDRVLEAGRVLEAAGRAEDAYRLYEEGLTSVDDDRIRYRLTDLALRMHRTDRALELLGELAGAATDEGERRRYSLARGRLLLDSERYEEARRLFEAMAADDPDDEEVTVLLAVSWYKLGQSATAVDVLEELLVDQPRAGRAVVTLARILADLHRFARADTLLAQAIAEAVDPLPELYVTRVTVLEQWGKTDAASDLFAEAVDRFPDNPRLLFEYGVFLDRRGEKDAALASMERVLELDPEDPYALNYVGYTWADAGIRLEEALQYCERAVNLRPRDGFIRDSLGWAYFRLGRFIEAVRELQYAHDLEPDDPTILEHLGDALERTGEMEAARKCWDEALTKLGDDEDEARNRLLQKLGRSGDGGGKEP